jgi:hypothetical protein
VNRHEEELARQVASFLCYVSPLCQWWHTPNGMARSRAIGGIFKAQGMKAGVPDLGFLLPGPPWRAWIELKTDSGRPSPAQLAWFRECDAFGIPHAICRSVLAVDEQLRAWGVEYLVEPAGFYEQIVSPA